ncbi:MAG: radical SAM protein [Candidatus Altiarchaeales archaeon]|nr:radical SAM protein [Candidatus Altiarchaeales archaeon]MBD3415565.1 radical SAM protein [Candidatus Altiarchaeales archaeon]
MHFAKYITPRIKDIIRNSIPYRYAYLRSITLSKAPFAVNIELTNRCNLKCTICPRPHIKDLALKDMDFGLFKRIVDEVSAFSGRRTCFYLVGLGEPLLYPRLDEAIRYLRKTCPKNPIHLSTNGVMLDRDKSAMLCHNLGLKSIMDLSGGGDRLLVSLNAGDRKAYNSMMGSDEFGRVTENILDFIDVRRTIGDGPNLVIQVIRTKSTKRQIDDFIDHWKPLIRKSDHLHVRDLFNWGGQIDTSESTHEIQGRYPCISLWIGLVVDVNGNVYPCCEALSTREKSGLLMGNIGEKPLKDIYYGKIGEFRSAHINSEWDRISECERCDFWSGNPNIWIKWGNRWV